MALLFFAPSIALSAILKSSQPSFSDWGEGSWNFGKYEVLVVKQEIIAFVKPNLAMTLERSKKRKLYAGDGKTYGDGPSPYVFIHLSHRIIEFPVRVKNKCNKRL